MLETYDSPIDSSPLATAYDTKPTTLANFVHDAVAAVASTSADAQA